jgi:hypothetical protein
MPITCEIKQRNNHGNAYGKAIEMLAVKGECAIVSHKMRPAQDSLEDAHHLGSLLVDGCGVEVVDGHVAFGPDRVGHRPAVFRELRERCGRTGDER